VGILLHIVPVYFAYRSDGSFGSATAPALIVVGILMAESLAKIAWDNFEEASAGLLYRGCNVLCLQHCNRYSGRVYILLRRKDIRGQGERGTSDYVRGIAALPAELPVKRAADNID
jgi:hypothetical protein